MLMGNDGLEVVAKPKSFRNRRRGGTFCKKCVPDPSPKTPIIATTSRTHRFLTPNMGHVHAGKGPWKRSQTLRLKSE